MPFLRAIQRSRRAFHSLSEEIFAVSLLNADVSSRAALSSAAGEKSSSLGTAYMGLLLFCHSERSAKHGERNSYSAHAVWKFVGIPRGQTAAASERQIRGA